MRRNRYFSSVYHLLHWIRFTSKMLKMRFGFVADILVKVIYLTNVARFDNLNRLCLDA